MKIAVLGGAGAMGALYGGYLAQSGVDVVLVDRWREAVEAINEQGLQIQDVSGNVRVIRVRATTCPEDVGRADLVIVLVKGYSTVEAVAGASTMIGDNTIVLTLQNGPSNVQRIIEVVGKDRAMAGVTLHSVTVLGPGHILHAGNGMTYVGELDGHMSNRLKCIVEILSNAGFEVSASSSILKVCWEKLSLNACALAPCSLLRFYSGQLVEHEGTLNLMRAILEEVVAVANAQGIALDPEERWQAILGQLKRASSVKASMLQDVEKRRKTEIHTINGEIVEAGRRLGIPTPYNNTMVWMVEALEETFSQPPPA